MPLLEVLQICTKHLLTYCKTKVKTNEKNYNLMEHDLPFFLFFLSNILWQEYILIEMLLFTSLMKKKGIFLQVNCQYILFWNPIPYVGKSS